MPVSAGPDPTGAAVRADVPSDSVCQPLASGAGRREDGQRGSPLLVRGFFIFGFLSTCGELCDILPGVGQDESSTSDRRPVLGKSTEHLDRSRTQ